MIKKVKESTYDWYVLNVREFYKKWFENLGARIKEVADTPLHFYKEYGFKEVLSECWFSSYSKGEEGFDKIRKNSLLRFCGIKQKREGLELG